MDITIDKTNENPYLQRKEIHGKVSFTGATPSHKQFIDAFATKLNVKADAVFVQHLYTSFGSTTATFEAHVYPSKEQLGKIVRLGKKAKEKLAKGAATPAAAQAAAPAGAAPAETAKAAEAKPAEPRKEEPQKAEA